MWYCYTSFLIIFQFKFHFQIAFESPLSNNFISNLVIKDLSSSTEILSETISEFIFIVLSSTSISLSSASNSSKLKSSGLSVSLKASAGSACRTYSVQIVLDYVTKVSIFSSYATNICVCSETLSIFCRVFHILYKKRTSPFIKA